MNYYMLLIQNNIKNKIIFVTDVLFKRCKLPVNVGGITYFQHLTIGSFDIIA